MNEVTKKRSLTRYILVSMGLALVAGLIIKTQNYWLEWLPFSSTLRSLIESAIQLFMEVLKFLANVFVASLQVTVVPLVFVSLVSGVCSLQDVSRMGRIGAKTLALYLGSTAVAVTLALSLGLLLKPGQGFNMDVVLTGPGAGGAFEAPSLLAVLTDLFPRNPIKAMAEGNMLQIIVFSFLVGFAIQRAGEAGKRIAGFFADLNQVVLKLVGIVVWFSPIGVFAVLTRVVAEQGTDALFSLGKYFLVVAFALLLQGFGVYSFFLSFFGRLNPVTFFKKFRQVALFSFGTASSNATIPVTLDTVENRMGVSNSVASFTIPLGATINMDGTAIMQGVATAFIAQVYGIELGVTSILMVILAATLASIGTAGVPSVGLVTLAMVLKQAGLPLDGIALIMGVDRILDMLRTTVNVAGDSVMTCIVARSEGEMDEKIFNAKERLE